jgi:hypothetical protein
MLTTECRPRGQAATDVRMGRSLPHLLPQRIEQQLNNFLKKRLDPRMFISEQIFNSS